MFARDTLRAHESKEAWERAQNGGPTASELHQLYWVEKKTLTEIAKQFGVTRQAIHQRMKRYSVKRRTRGPRSLVRQKFVDLLISGVDLKTAAESCGLSWDYARSIAVDYAPESVPPALNRRHFDIEALTKLYVEDRRSIRSIAWELDADEKTVERALRNAGVEIRRRNSLTTIATREWLMERYAVATQPQIAAELGVSLGRVTQILRARGVSKHDALAHANRGAV